MDWAKCLPDGKKTFAFTYIHLLAKRYMKAMTLMVFQLAHPPLISSLTDAHLLVIFFHKGYL